MLLISIPRLHRIFTGICLIGISNSPGAPTHSVNSPLESSRSLSLGSPLFTLSEWYNPYDHNGDPLGLLERETAKQRLRLRGISSWRAGAGDSLDLASSGFFLPELALNQPGVFSLMLYYNRSADHMGWRRTNIETADAAKWNFGFDIAVGSDSRLIQLGLSAHAGMGKTTGGDGDERLQAFVDEARISLGSEIWHGLNLGFYLGMGGLGDTLRSGAGLLDRYVEADIPTYGLFLDFGDSTWLAFAKVPLYSNLSLDFGTERFYGVYKGASLSSTDYNPRWTSYRKLDWKTQYFLGKKEFEYGPALRLGSWKRETQRYAFKDNSSPFEVGDALPGEDWTFSGLELGLGSSLRWQDYGSCYGEWEYQGISLGDSAKGGYHRFLLGLEGNAHGVAALGVPEGMEIFIRLSYAAGSENPMFPRHRPNQFRRFNPIFQHDSQVNGYKPSLEEPEVWSAIGTGLGVGLWKRKLEANLHLGLITRREAGGDVLLGRVETSGVEVGWGVSYSGF